MGEKAETHKVAINRREGVVFEFMWPGDLEGLVERLSNMAPDQALSVEVEGGVAIIPFGVIRDSIITVTKDHA